MEQLPSEPPWHGLSLGSALLRRRALRGTVAGHQPVRGAAGGQLPAAVVTLYLGAPVQRVPGCRFLGVGLNWGEQPPSRAARTFMIYPELFGDQIPALFELLKIEHDDV